MNIQYTGRHFQVDDRVRAFAESKLGKLAKFLDDPVELHLTLEIEKRRQIAELHVAPRNNFLARVRNPNPALEPPAPESGHNDATGAH